MTACPADWSTGSHVGSMKTKAGEWVGSRKQLQVPELLMEPPLCSRTILYPQFPDLGTMRENKHLSYSLRHEGLATLAKAGVKKLDACLLGIHEKEAWP